MASVNFFEDPFTMFAHFMMGDLQAHLLQPPYLSSLSPSDFSKFPWSKKVLKGKHFTDIEEVKQKNGRSTKKHQNRCVQKLF